MEKVIEYVQNYILPLTPLVFILVMVSQLVLRIISQLGKHPRIEVYPAGNAEIGFSQYGPTVTLFGTLRAQHADAFISQVTLIATNTDRHVSRALEWRALKPYVFSLGTKETMQWELVSAFLLTTQSPFKYHILFVDEPFLAEHTALVSHIQSLWQVYQERSGESTASPQLFFEDFLQLENVRKILGDLRKSFYWESGKYQLEIQIHTSNPDKIHTTTFELTLSETQTGVLEENLTKILQIICGMDTSCEAVFPEYKKI